MTREDLKTLLKRFALQFFMTGSREICSPPVMDTDEDWVVLVPDSYSSHWLTLAGFVMTTDETGYDGSWMCCYRKGEFNLVLTSDPVFFDRFEAATALAKKRNITSKEARLHLFRSLLYNTTEYRDMKPEESFL